MEKGSRVLSSPGKGKRASVYKRYVLPGIIFQSLVISGGYGTGRELCEFFMQNGSKGGLVAMLLVSLPIWAIICALSFDFAHKNKTFEYKGMFSKLLGKGFLAYELCYIISLVLTLSVIASASGELGRALFGFHYKTGVLFIMTLITLLVFLGESAISGFLSCWSFVLYAVYAVFFVLCFQNFGGNIVAQVATGEMGQGWFLGGIKYAFSNIASIPACLFAVKYAENRRQAVMAGVIAGLIGILPGVFLYLSMLGLYPHIVNQALPLDYIFSLLNVPWLRYVFQFVLLGTLVETGTGLIFAVTERYSSKYRVKGEDPPKLLTPVITVALILAGCVLSTLGLKTLVSKGYGTIAWVFLLVYALPLLWHYALRLFGKKAKGETRKKAKYLK